MRRPAARCAPLVLAALALAAAGLGPTAAPALAAADLVTVVNAGTHTAPPGDLPSGKRVECPAGTRLVALGFAAVAPPLYLTLLAFSAADPDDPPDGTRGFVTVHNVGSDPHAFSAYGLCLATGASEVAYAALERTFGAGTRGGVTVGCPIGTKRVAGAGGVFRRFVDAPPAVVTGGYPADAGWSTYLSNLRPGAKEVGVRSETSCAFAAALRVRVVTAAGVPAPPGTTTKRVSCPRGAEIAGGGFRTPTSGSLAVVASRPVVPRSTANPEGWAVRVANNGATATSFTAYAVCVSLA